MAKYENYVIAVDFDGTLVENRFPEIGKVKSNVVKKITKRIEKLKRKGIAKNVTLILWTCRGNEEKRAYLNEAIECCRNDIPELEFKYYNENPENIFGDTTRKIFANEYWDDRAIKVK